MINIIRSGIKDNYKYKYPDGKEVKDVEILEYIKKLVIPPNYKNITIFYEQNGEPKILYQGYDSKNRLQRIYSPSWNLKASKRKFCELLNFSLQVPNIINKIEKLLSSNKNSKNKTIATVLKLVMLCYIRIGNKKYLDLYGSHGAMNLKKKHILKNDDSYYIEFKGKKGVINSCNLYDKKFLKELDIRLKKLKDDDFTFTYNNKLLKAIDINNWLKGFDPVITSKIFRTYDANIFLIKYLKNNPNPIQLLVNEKKKIVVKALKEISSIIHNTPSILKKNYTQGGIIDMYINQSNRFNRYFYNKDNPRISLINYLNDYCKDYITEKKRLIKEGAKKL
jgi:DNA topoisomerase I